LSRPSTPFSLKGRNKDVDARDKRGHDVERWFDLIGTRSSVDRLDAELSLDFAPQGFHCRMVLPTAFEKPPT
jgi:hypothetical protein